MEEIKAITNVLMFHDSDNSQFFTKEKFDFCVKALIEKAKGRSALTEELKDLETRMKEERKDFEPLTWPEMAMYLKDHKLAEFAADVAKDRMESDTIKSWYCCLSCLGCLKWVRGMAVSSKAKSLQS